MKMDLRSKKGLRTDFDQLHSHSLPSSLFRVFFSLEHRRAAQMTLARTMLMKRKKIPSKRFLRQRQCQRV